MRGVTFELERDERKKSISTHTPHARRDLTERHYEKKLHISTHTPHARRDLTITGCSPMHSEISTHTPHARRDAESNL